MAKRKVLKITPVLVTLNIIVLLIIATFYSYRLVKYYSLENSNTKSEDIILVDSIIKTQSYVDLTKGLIFDKDSNTYTFKGDADNNYVLYSGIVFRILSIDKDKNIKMVSDKSLTMMYSGLEKGYNSSYINKWLNKSNIEHSGIFESVLYSSDSFLTNTSLCGDIVDDIDNISCSEINKDNKITLLSLSDYKNAGGSKSFLNNGESFYLSSLNSKNANYYINNDGDIGTNIDTTKIYGVRPVITIKSETKLIKGNGSKEKPYQFESHQVTSLSNIYVGDIINIDGINYKVVELGEQTVKVVLNDIYKSNGEPVKLYFDKTLNTYVSTNALYKYLNNNYLNTISIKDDIIPKNWYIGKLTLDNLDYIDVYKNESYAKIGMLTLGDLFVGDVNNVFTLSRGIQDDTIINIINDNGNVYGDFINNYHYVRPSFYLSKNISITSGIGTIDGPYELGDIDE